MAVGTFIIFYDQNGQQWKVPTDVATKILVTTSLQQLRDDTTAFPWKVDKITTPNIVYGTDADGNQISIGIDQLGKIDDVLVNGVSIVTDRIASIDNVVQTDKANTFTVEPQIPQKAAIPQTPSETSPATEQQVGQAETQLDAKKVDRATFATEMVVEQMDFTAAANDVGVKVVKTNVNDNSQQTGEVHISGANGTEVGLTFDMQTGQGALTIDTNELKQDIQQEAAARTAADGNMLYPNGETMPDLSTGIRRIGIELSDLANSKVRDVIAKQFDGSEISLVDENKVAHIDYNELGKVQDITLNGQTLVEDHVADLTGKVVDTSTDQTVMGVKSFLTPEITDPIVVMAKESDVSKTGTQVYATEAQVYKVFQKNNAVDEEW